LRQEDIPRFGKLKVVASMQPFHAIDDGRWAWKRLDEKRLKGTYAFRTILDSGGVLAFGSDSPVAPMNPILGIYAAVTRRTLDDKNPNGWIPNKRSRSLKPSRALLGLGLWRISGRRKGTIELANSLISFCFLTTILHRPVNIRNVKVLMTIVNGSVVYEAK
jgi:predicted amidohydrolase YtcJ